MVPHGVRPNMWVKGGGQNHNRHCWGFFEVTSTDWMQETRCVAVNHGSAPSPLTRLIAVRFIAWHTRGYCSVSQIFHKSREKSNETKKQQHIRQNKAWDVTQSLEIWLTLPTNRIARISSLKITLIHLVSVQWTVFPIRLIFFQCNPRAVEFYTRFRRLFSQNTEHCVSSPWLQICLVSASALLIDDDASVARGRTANFEPKLIC